MITVSMLAMEKLSEVLLSSGSGLKSSPRGGNQRSPIPPILGLERQQIFNIYTGQQWQQEFFLVEMAIVQAVWIFREELVIIYWPTIIYWPSK